MCCLLFKSVSIFSKDSKPGVSHEGIDLRVLKATEELSSHKRKCIKKGIFQLKIKSLEILRWTQVIGLCILVKMTAAVVLCRDSI